VISNIIAEADKLTQDENPSLHTSAFVFDDSRDAEVDELDGMVLVRTVLVMHSMLWIVQKYPCTMIIKPPTLEHSDPPFLYCTREMLKK